MAQTDPPAYCSALFVNRENEIKAVTNALQNIARGDSEQMRTIVFRGERGLGKSWLALHLHRSSVLKKRRRRTITLCRYSSALHRHLRG